MVVGSARARTTTAATSSLWIGWKRAVPPPASGTNPGDRRTSPAMMLKNPSPSPNWTDGFRIVESRPEPATSASALAFELA
jgi:hypothetical protein